ncbi:MAG: hypothetical protein WCK78_01125 [Paludibacter sp.]
MKRITFICLLSALLLPVNMLAQYSKMVDVLEDTESEMNDGKQTLRFFDAKTGQTVKDGVITISGIGEFRSDSLGRVRFDKVKDDKYTFHFTKNGYISADYQFEVIEETIFLNRFSVCPITELGAIRIVLDWSRHPSDLDLHLIKSGSYHISYQDMQKSADGAAQLDRDDMNGYGPETITINKTDNTANYICFVHDFSDKSNPRTSALSRSKAVLRVYDNNQLKDTFYVPRDKTGNKWSVFEIKRGEIIDINKLSGSN